MSTTLIEGYPPHVYAAQWGSTDAEGVYFYNYGSERCVKDAKWLAKFVVAIEHLLVRLQDKKQLDGKDSKGLQDLLAYVKNDHALAVQRENMIRCCGVPV